jgi:hypothetical protein
METHGRNTVVLQTHFTLCIPEGGNVYKTLALLQKIKINKAKCMIVGKCIYILYAWRWPNDQQPYFRLDDWGFFGTTFQVK